jgi:hypothetical protein
MPLLALRESAIKSLTFTCRIPFYACVKTAAKLNCSGIFVIPVENESRDGLGSAANLMLSSAAPTGETLRRPQIFQVSTPQSVTFRTWFPASFDSPQDHGDKNVASNSRDEISKGRRQIHLFPPDEAATETLTAFARRHTSKQQLEKQCDSRRE